MLTWLCMTSVINQTFTNLGQNYETWNYKDQWVSWSRWLLSPTYRSGITKTQCWWATSFEGLSSQIYFDFQVQKDLLLKILDFKSILTFEMLHLLRILKFTSLFQPSRLSVLACVRHTSSFFHVRSSSASSEHFYS